MYTHIKDIPQFPHAGYCVTMPWGSIKKWFDDIDQPVEVDPPYQRGYVWTTYQQERYVEHLLRGGRSGRDIFFNCPNWRLPVGNTPWHDTVELVDGKQRINALLGFLGGSVLVFGKTVDEYEDARMVKTGMRHTLNFHVNELATPREVVEWYLGMNAGGSIHTEEDLAIARALL